MIKKHNLRELPARRQETYLQQMRNKNYIRRNAAIIDGWVRLYICITTNDINEFYKALSGKVPRKGVKKHYEWEMATKPYERNRK